MKITARSIQGKSSRKIHTRGDPHGKVHMSGDQNGLGHEQLPHGDEQKLDTTQNVPEPHGRSIIMLSGPITRSRAKKLKQAFQAFVQELINEEESLHELGSP